jgi:hypothetical protein
MLVFLLSLACFLLPGGSPDQASDTGECRVCHTGIDSPVPGEECPEDCESCFDHCD